jgi:hypothetical protein
MVRSYKPKTEWNAQTLEPLQKAVEAVQNGNTFRQAAQEYGVTRARIWRAMKNLSVH